MLRREAAGSDHGARYSVPAGLQSAKGGATRQSTTAPPAGPDTHARAAATTAYQAVTLEQRLSSVAARLVDIMQGHMLMPLGASATIDAPAANATAAAMVPPQHASHAAMTGAAAHGPQMDDVMEGSLALQPHAHGRVLTDEELVRELELFVSPDVVLHPDGLLRQTPVRGLSGLVSACRAEWAGYGAEGGFLPQLLLVATQVTRDVSSSAKDNAFLLMQWRVRNTGEHAGLPPTDRVSAGISMLRVSFDIDAHVTEVWAQRQMTQEERCALLQHPASQAPHVFDASCIACWGEDAHKVAPAAAAVEGSVRVHEEHAAAAAAPASDSHAHAGAHAQRHTGQAHASRHNMLGTLDMWVQAWNVSTDSGSVNPEVFDCLLEDDFEVHDALGWTHDLPHQAGHVTHPYAALHSREDAKNALLALTLRYDVDEHAHAAAVANATNAAFVHWQATMRPKASQHMPSIGAPLAAPGSGEAAMASSRNDDAGSSPAGMLAPSTAQPYTAEGMELVLFATNGRIRSVVQFRKPLGIDRRDFKARSTGGHDISQG